MGYVYLNSGAPFTIADGKLTHWRTLWSGCDLPILELVCILGIDLLSLPTCLGKDLPDLLDLLTWHRFYEITTLPQEPLVLPDRLLGCSLTAAARIPGPKNQGVEIATIIPSDQLENLCFPLLKLSTQLDEGFWVWVVVKDALLARTQVKFY